MSQFFRALKKSPKIHQEKSVEIQSEEETNDYNESTDDLIQFCEKLNDFVSKSRDTLEKAYNDEYHRSLQTKLKSSVKELICIQNEIKSIINNIRSLKVQISAVQMNLCDHKDKVSALKSEERRAKLTLSHEKKKRDKNVTNQEKAINKERPDTALAKYYITSPDSAISRQLAYTSVAIRPTYISIPELPTAEFSVRPRNPNRPSTSAAKRSKPVRLNLESLAPLPQEQSNITLHLRPINEMEKSENSSHDISSHNSTPNNSVFNFNARPEQTQSETAASSILSASNSLFVFSSNTEIDDLD